MADTAIASLRQILNGFRALNSKGIYSMNATETDLLRQILTEVQALSLGATVADGSITAVKLASDAVTTAKILNANITTAKIADSNITTAKIADSNVTPAKLSGGQSGAAPIFGVRAWVSFNGTGTVAIRGSGNVSSITDNGTGDYTVNMTTALPDANYAVVGSSGGASGTTHGSVYLLEQSTARTTSLFRVATVNTVGSLVDTPFIDVMVIR